MELTIGGGGGYLRCRFLVTLIHVVFVIYRHRLGLFFFGSGRSSSHRGDDWSGMMRYDCVYISRNPLFSAINTRLVTRIPRSSPACFVSSMPRSRSRDSQRRSESPSNRLPGGAEPISDSDYFVKSPEFRVWLKEEKHKVPFETSNDDRSMLKPFSSVL
jgi:hypothetical protein